MGIERIREIAAIFIAEGKDRLPVAVIENGSAHDEKTIVGVVETIAELVEDHKISSPALLVFGDVVSLHPSFNSIRDFYHILSEG